MSNPFTGFGPSTGGSSTFSGPRSPASPPRRRPGGARVSVLLAFLLAFGAIALGPSAGAQSSQTAAPPRPVWAVDDRASIYRSTDGAEHWVVANNLACENLAVSRSAPQIAYTDCSARRPPYRYSVFKTTDGGQSWARKSTGLPSSGGIDLITVDPAHPQVVYLLRGSLAQLFRTRDGGEHWRHIRTRSCGPYVGYFIPGYPRPTCYFYGGPRFGAPSATQLVINPRNPRVMYAATGGVKKSTDGGRTWIGAASKACYRRQCYPTSVIALALDPGHPSVLYAGSMGGVYKTTDAGRTWARMRKGLPSKGFVWALALDPKDSTVLYAVVYASSGYFYVYKSTNGGRTWSRKSRGIYAELEESFPLAIDSDTPATVYAGGAGVLKSSDGGATWAPKNEGISTRGRVPTIYELTVG